MASRMYLGGRGVVAATDDIVAKLADSIDKVKTLPQDGIDDLRGES